MVEIHTFLWYPIIMKYAWKSLILALGFLALSTTPVWAVDGSVLGIHILSPSEAQAAEKLFQADHQDQKWHYVTIPLSLDDLNQKDAWNNFFAYAKEQKLIPIVRLASKFDNGAWVVPTKSDIVNLISFLSSLNWPTDDKYIIVFNEVNHSKEWGGHVDPAEYAGVLQFTSDWAKSENKNYKILPAAMDLAAPNGGSTREAFSYLDAMRQTQPRIFDFIDYWNSHSYPNPAFSAPPGAKGQNSLSGFQDELAYLQQKTGRDYETFITETGWIENASTRPWLTSYYEYAVQHVWNDPHVKAVTPFVLEGDPGPFSGFTFLNRNGQPTAQYEAYQKVMSEVPEKM